MIKNEEKINKFLNKIKSLGYEAFVIGGFVRDKVLNLPCNDYDISTNIDKKILYDNFKVIKWNEQFKNFTIIEDNITYEITQYRKDTYNKSRFPKTAVVKTIEEDILRRDFTINCIYMDSNYQIFYPLTSKKDLNSKLIRSVKEYNKSYNEDPLRIIRALKYSEKLNFTIIEEEYNYILNNSNILSKLKKDRIIREIEGICFRKEYMNIIRNYI